MPKTEKDTDRLVLKWGTLKEWHFKSDKAKELLREYHQIGSSFSAMLQKDTARQKEILCELIDECDGEIWNDWENEKMTKKEAKVYVREYGKAHR